MFINGKIDRTFKTKQIACDPRKKKYKLETPNVINARDVNNRNKQTLMCAIGISSSNLQSFVSITRCHLLHIIKPVVCKSAWAWLNNNSYLCLWKEFPWKFINGIAFQRVWFSCFLCICYVFSLRTTLLSLDLIELKTNLICLHLIRGYVYSETCNKSSTNTVEKKTRRNRYI